MNEIFVKKYWEEEKILFYLHFQNGEAIRQVEVTPNSKKLLSLVNPQQGESMLYDQSLQDLDLVPEDFITKEEFDEAWGA